MRKLMWMALGVSLMCAACAYLSSLLALCIGLAAAVIGLAALTAYKRNVRARIVSFVCIGFVLGWMLCGCYEYTTLSKARDLENQDRFIRAQVTDYSFQTDYGTAAEVDLELDGATFSAQLYFNQVVSLKPGDWVEGTFRMDYTGGENATYHFGKGILLLGYQQDVITITEAVDVPVSMKSAVWRKNIVDVIDACFDRNSAAFAKALLLGDRTEVDYELSTAFKVTGISHIIAVSGMHLSILAAVIYVLAAKKRWIMAMLGVPAVLLFAAVAGFTPSITRACIMQVLLLVALILDRDYDPLTSLGVAALIMLFINPMVITSVSFRLSFGCMAGIFLFSGRIYQRIAKWGFWKDAKRKSLRARLRRWIAGSLAVTLGAMVFTTPLCAIHFGAVSLVGVLTNLLVLWLVSLIFPCVILVCIISAFSTPLATVLAGIVSLPIGLLLSFVQWLAGFPMCAVYTESIFILVWIVLSYVLFGLFLLRREGLAVLTCASAIMLCLALLGSWVVPKSTDVQMTVLDVGQGQCVILTAKGRTFVVDCGGDYDESTADLAAETLLSQGIYRVDGLILTHYDRDHAGGAAYFLSRIPADRVFLSPAGDTSRLRNEIEAAAGNAAFYVLEDKKMSWDGGSITLFSPVLGNSDNESGISVLFSGENCDILITGDMSSVGERLLLMSRDIPKLEVLVAGHHGANTSTSAWLLERTAPEMAIISVGENRYGHPSADALDRLTDYGCQIRRTDTEGTIVYRR